MGRQVVRKNENVFDVLGFEKEEAANLLIRTDLMIELSAYIKKNNLSLRKAGAFFGVGHSRINDILQGNVDQFTIDYLVKLLAKTGKRASIKFEDMVKA